MTKKQVLRFVAFAVASFMLIVLLCDLFESENYKNHDQNMYTYRNLPIGTVDAVFLGTSGVDRFWIAPKGYEEYGLALHNVAFDAFPAWLYENIIDEVTRNQDIKLILLDARPFYQGNKNSDAMEVRARRYLDALPFFSVNRIKAAFTTMKVLHQAEPEEREKFDASFLFSFIKYHTKWEDKYSLYDNLGSKKQKFGSYFTYDGRIIRQKEQEKVVYNPEKVGNLDPVAEEALYNLIDYIKENDLEVLFVDTPQFMWPYEMKRANALYDILDENGLNYLHFYKENSDEFTIDLDNETDFYDESHVNYYGAQKFTEALAEYISENYDLPDARENETANEFWEGKYEKIQKAVEKFEKEKAEKDKKKK